MDLNAFLKWEKDIIREERERLCKIVENEANTSEINENICPAEGLSNEKMQCNRNKVKEKQFLSCNINPAKSQFFDRSVTSSSSSDKNETTSSSTPTCTSVQSQIAATPRNTKLPSGLLPTLEKARESPVGSSNETFSIYTNCAPERENENAAHVMELEREDLRVLSKTAKESANQQTAFSINSMALTEDNHVSNVITAISNERKQGKNKDDMEQWVTDTFYSYFPGYNDELQKRQRYLRERQQENQQNLLRHQLAHPPMSRYAFYKSKQLNQTDQTVNTAGSSTTTSSNITNTSTTMSHPTNKTDLEIIVNNPGYVPPKLHSSRPNTTRNKLLQDLRHTELSQIVGGDGATERNRNNAELESNRKKDYQRELMQQIEEKRRSIELLREKERHQEEALTRRLQEQLKTIQLEEQLEKEKMRADKLRFDSEQNRLMREQLLAKLENDSRLLNLNTGYSNTNKMKSHDLVTNKVENVPGTATTADIAAICDADNNKVYKYFSNSARHEYRRGKPLPEELELDLGVETLKTVRDDDEHECFHLSEKVCPMCDAPLKNYESCCLRCQKTLSLRMKAHHNDNGASEKINLQDDDGDGASSKEGESYSMVCAKCERLYGLCSTCLAQNDVCRACHRKRNVCLNCRRTLCSRCLDEIASGRDTEKSHVNELSEAQKQTTNRTDAESLRSFQVLEVNYGVLPERKNNDAKNLVSPRRYITNHSEISQSDSIESPQKLPYSINIEKNSIFHPDYKPVQQINSFNQLHTTPSDDQFNIERVRKETDKRLSRYLRNYGDLAVNPRLRSKSESGNDRSTQTTPNTASRRDVVMHEEHNLSMPLLREMPKMTRPESDRMLLRKPSHIISNRIQQLKRRWEVPAVQKFTISSTSPKVLTQVGAIRKQLQADNLMGDV